MVRRAASRLLSAEKQHHMIMWEHQKNTKSLPTEKIISYLVCVSRHSLASIASISTEIKHIENYTVEILEECHISIIHPFLLHSISRVCSSSQPPNSDSIKLCIHHIIHHTTSSSLSYTLFLYEGHSRPIGYYLLECESESAGWWATSVDVKSSLEPPDECEDGGKREREVE